MSVWVIVCISENKAVKYLIGIIMEFFGPMISKSTYDSVYGYNALYDEIATKQERSKKIKFDPQEFKINEWYQTGEYLVVKINYPSAQHYEGNKVLVYEGITIEELKKQKVIDPHFSENKEFPSPIARFAPTDQGWLNAMRFSSMLHSERLEVSY